MTATLTERVNGHLQKGRDVPPEKLHPFTFEGTGRTVQIRKLSALIRDEVHRAVRRDASFPKEPEPPIQEVDYGEGKIKRPNRQHSVFLEMQREWQAKFLEEVSERLVTLIIRRAVVCEIDAQAVAQARADMAAIDVPLDEYDDHYVYVAFVCVGPRADYNDLLRVVFERSMPSEEVVQAHIDSFRGPVPGPEPVASEPGPASGENQL